MKNITQSYASLWDRLVAFAFDYLVIALYLIELSIVGFIVNISFPRITATLFANPFAAQLTGFTILTLPVTLYFALLESSSGHATWGKRQRHLKVAHINGERDSHDSAHSLVPYSNLSRRNFHTPVI